MSVVVAASKHAAAAAATAPAATAAPAKAAEKFTTTAVVVELEMLETPQTVIGLSSDANDVDLVPEPPLSAHTKNAVCAIRG